MNKKITPPTPEQIRICRIGLGFTQEELGLQVGASESAVCRWEAGKRVPGPWYAARLRRMIRKAEKTKSSLRYE